MNGFKLRTKMAITIATTFSVFASGAQAVNLVGINSSNQIGIFDSDNVENAIFNNITGDAFGQNFIGIDLRPSNNLVYGLTRSNNIFTIDAFTGNSSFVTALNTPIITMDKSYGIDFNPVADRGTGASLRLVSSTGDNYAINANTGAVTVATSIPAGFSGVAYSNSNPSTPAITPANTALFYINSSNDTLSVATSGFNNPIINPIGALGIDVLSANGFEIFANGIGFAAVNMDDGALKSNLISINTTTGAASLLGTFNGTINGLSAAPVPEPETFALFLAGLGMMGFTTRRKNKSVLGA